MLCSHLGPKKHQPSNSSGALSTLNPSCKKFGVTPRPSLASGASRAGMVRLGKLPPSLAPSPLSLSLFEFGIYGFRGSPEVSGHVSGGPFSQVFRVWGLRLQFSLVSGAFMGPQANPRSQFPTVMPHEASSAKFTKSLWRASAKVSTTSASHPRGAVTLA